MLSTLASGLSLPPTGVVADDGCKDGGGDAEYSFDVVMFGSACWWRRCTGRWQILTHGPAGNLAGREGVLLARRGGGRNENSVHFPVAKSRPCFWAGGVGGGTKTASIFRAQNDGRGFGPAGWGVEKNSAHFPGAKSVPPLNVVIKIVAGKWPLFFRGRRPGPGFWGGSGTFSGEGPVALVQLLARPRPAGKNEGPDQHG